MSENLNNAEEVLNSFDEEPVEPTDDGYTNKLSYLHALEDEAWSRVADGSLTAWEAEEAIETCRMWVYEEDF